METFIPNTEVPVRTTSKVLAGGCVSAAGMN